MYTHTSRYLIALVETVTNCSLYLITSEKRKEKEIDPFNYYYCYTNIAFFFLFFPLLPALLGIL